MLSSTIGYYTLGVVCSVLYIYYIRRINNSLKTEFLNFAIGLIIAALIYVCFALWHQKSEWYFLEWSGVILYGALAYLGFKYSAWFLVLGWSTHILWDVILHMNEKALFVPHWYPPVCLIFDLILAIYIGYNLLKTRPKATQLNTRDQTSTDL